MTFVTRLVRVQARRDGFAHAAIRWTMASSAAVCGSSSLDSFQMLRVIELCGKTN